MTSPARTEAFSDGVLAVAITLLVLDLKVPHVEGNLLAALLQGWLPAAAFVVSFATIGIIWVNHHGIFDRLERVDRTLLYLNLALLMTVVLIPFSTSLLADYLGAGHDSGTAAAVYGLNMSAMGVAFGSIWRHATGRGLIAGLDPVAARAFMWRFAVGTPLYVLAVAAALVDARLSLFIYAALAVYYAAFVTVPGRPRRAAGDGGGPE
jgi:uncharacterized membrane protein